MCDSVLDTIQVVLPDGNKKIINRSGNVLELIKNYCMDKNYENYALVFFGRKLPLDQKLEALEHLNINRPLYIICQHTHQKMSNDQCNAEINKKLQACRASYRKLIDDAPHQLSAEAFKFLLSYMHENNCENFQQTLIDFPNLISDHVGFAAVSDFRLLIQFIMKEDKFVYEHPDCLSIFKKVIDNIAGKFSSTSTSVRFPNSMRDVPAPLHQQNSVIGTPLITQQMLSQAFAVAFGEREAHPTSNLQQGSSTQQTGTPGMEVNNYRVTFNTQLQQMNEFGFTNNEENIQALLLTNGDVEQALQIVIAMRE